MRFFPNTSSSSETDMPVPGDGEVLLRVILMSIDAANRSWLQGQPTVLLCKRAIRCPPMRSVKWSHQTARNTASVTLSPPRPHGPILSPPKRHKVQKLPKVETLSHLMSVYGIAGKTAYHGLMSIGQPVAGETVLVSAAAGSVGGYVGQIAKALGCRVVGIAGGPEKCKWVAGRHGL